MKEEKISITAEGLLPFLAFPDIQAFCDSLSMKEINSWNDKLSLKDEVHADTIRTALALYVIEKGNNEMTFTLKQVDKICTDFTIIMGLMHNVRIGRIKITSGRVMMTQNNARFTITDAGKTHVENNLLKR